MDIMEDQELTQVHRASNILLTKARFAHVREDHLDSLEAMNMEEAVMD